MKKSRAVPLILLGTLTLLSGCGGESEPEKKAEVKQHIYTSREDCLNDWGRDERDCRPAGTGSHVYLGPRYYWHHGGGYPVAVDHDGSTRRLSGSFLSRPGATSRATGITTSTAHIGGGGARAGGSHGGGGGHVSRGGFGGTAHGFSGG